MNYVKQESNLSVCNSCLSSNRALSALNDEADLFTYLLGQTIIIDPENIVICWECKAVLRRMRNFQQQVQQAQIMLHQMFYEKYLVPKPLSNLSYCKLNDLEIINASHIEKEQTKEYTEVKIIGDFNTSDLLPAAFEESHKESTEGADYGVDDKKIIVKDEKIEICLEEYFPDLNDNGHSDQSEPETKIKTERKLSTKRNKKKSKKIFNRLALQTINPELDFNKVELCFEMSKLTDYELENIGRFNKKMRIKSLYCTTCKKEFDSAIEVKWHKTFFHILKSEEAGPFECLECKAVCPDKTSLRAHWAQHNTVRRCKICKATVTRYWYRKFLEDHARMHRYLWKCTACKHFDVVYRTLKDFSNHYRSIHRRSKCDYCGHSTKTKKSLIAHIRLKHLPPVCSICDKEFKNNHCLRRHLNDTHPEIIDKKVNPELTYCVECNKQFPSMAKYKLHYRTTMAHNPNVVRKVIVPCPECGKQFSRKSYMNNHYRLYHQKQTKHYCALCDKYLVSGWSLKKHMHGVHQKIREPKTKVCDICGRAFGTNSVLIKHVRTHTGERPYKCAHCPAAFAQSSALNSHTRTQHKA